MSNVVPFAPREFVAIDCGYAKSRIDNQHGIGQWSDWRFEYRIELIERDGQSIVWTGATREQALVAAADWSLPIVDRTGAPPVRSLQDAVAKAKFALEEGDYTTDEDINAIVLSQIALLASSKDEDIVLAASNLCALLRDNEQLWNEQSKLDDQQNDFITSGQPISVEFQEALSKSGAAIEISDGDVERQLHALAAMTPATSEGVEAKCRVAFAFQRLGTVSIGGEELMRSIRRGLEAPQTAATTPPYLQAAE